jgi:esterase/lipase superfamily enzyme
MAATILDSTDFNRKPEVRTKVVTIPDFIDDRVVVDNYWNNLADYVNVPLANLPATPSELVKEYLIICVCIDVASSSRGSNLQKITEDITVDQWEARYTGWMADKNKLLSDIKYSDVVDPNNEPDNNIPSNSMLSSRTRG